MPRAKLKPDNKPLLSIVMPVYKQENKIVRYLKILELVLNSSNYKYEVICVIDGRIDKSFEKAKSIKNPMIKVLEYSHNMGKGYAVRYGMKHAKGQIIGFVDGGHDVKYSSIPLALEHMKWYGADVVIGSKRHPASKVVYPWQRRIFSWGYQLGVRLLFGINVKDTQVGMKFFKGEVIKTILPKLLINEFAFDIEMLAVANRMGFNKIYEFPIEITMEFEGSTIASKSFLKTAWKMMWDTLLVFYRLKVLHYYDDANKNKWIKQ